MNNLRFGDYRDVSQDRVEPHYEAEPSYKVLDALRLVLLFHSGSPWDEAKCVEWFRITGTREASTKVLCDHVRSALAIYGTPKS